MILSQLITITSLCSLPPSHQSLTRLDLFFRDQSINHNINTVDWGVILISRYYLDQEISQPSVDLSLITV